MECERIQELLSAYHDGELSVEQRSWVAQHAQTCPRCREDIAAIERVSHATQELDDPDPPEGIWTRIESALDADQAGNSVAERAEPTAHATRWWRMPLLATAVSTFVAVAGIWMATTRWFAPDHHQELAADFDQYLESFSVDPVAAQAVLLANYNNRPVNIVEATEQLGYQPAVARGLPSRYSVESMHVLDMPCCKCLKTLCRRDDGKLLAIFEHEEAQPIWFGDRPRIDTECNGCQCCVIGVGRGLVASWQSNGRQLTVVGAHDLNEVTDLITHLQDTAG